MTHARQEFALGATGALGALARLLRLGNAASRLHGALAHALFEIVLIHAQVQIAPLELGQHAR